MPWVGDRFVVPELDGKTWFVICNGDFSKPHYWHGFDTQADAFRNAESGALYNGTERFVYHGTSWEDAAEVARFEAVTEVRVTLVEKKTDPSDPLWWRSHV